MVNKKSKVVADNKKEYFVKVCPNCKSPDVGVDMSNNLFFLLSSNYVCNACSHSGNLFPELPLSELEGFEGDVKREKLINSKFDGSPRQDARLGNFLVRVLWKVESILLIVVSILLFTGLEYYSSLSTFFNVLMALALLGIGFFMFYVAYFRKRSLIYEK